MCLYPRLLINRKYTPNKKNNFNPPKLTDERLKYVAVGCGNCEECRKQKAREWQVRLNEEIKVHKCKYFVTLTFSEDNLTKLQNEIKQSECNAVAGVAVRRFLERWRKKHKKSLTHWLITELGHTNTERIHLHGIIFHDTPITLEELQNTWQYGIVDNGKYVNTQTIAYIVKYVTKIDNDHKGFKAEIFCSAGLGKEYLNKDRAKANQYIQGNTNETYTLDNGRIVNLPIYYRNHIYSEEEREKLWIEKIEKDEMYINGIRVRNISSEKGIQQIEDILKQQQKDNISKGYGDNSREWNKKEYNTTLRKLNAKSRLQKPQKKRQKHNIN